ncbi:GPW/gp25 family protein [Fulvivirga sediminis]|uniref:GPW/gp25 family protein n=1 Tax=Fulvivirga sediminis TaxID=2803949 RepID=A0A937F5V7_9BACT|nr:GPW/gp25 family protein [Fulvivirga sediminis]MBL3655537.1 GPW/gp25 family protein [Fulvivirga sediminis]
MENDFLGRGWSFPPAFHAGGGELELVSGEQDIQQSLKILLSTSLNERVMAPDFGCELTNYLFEEIDQSLINEIRNAVSDAILTHEPRVQVEEVNITEVKRENGLLHISITYLVPATNNRHNLVYPFYLNEASINI